jgi:REP element-mobilizing transposase RayT
MPDRLHLCVDGPLHLSNEFVGRWKSFVTHESWKFGWEGKLWRERFLPKECEGEKAEAEVIEYVLENPVKAGLVHCWRDWPYWAEPLYKKMGWKEGTDTRPSLASCLENKPHN